MTTIPPDEFVPPAEEIPEVPAEFSPVVVSEDFGQPVQVDFSLRLEKQTREELAAQYRAEILRALAARRTAWAGGYRWEPVGPDRARAYAERSSLGHTKGMEQDLQDYWERYEQVPPDRDLPFEGAANYRVPLTKWIVDSIHSRIVAALTTVRPYSRVEPLEPGYEQEAQDLEEFLDWVKEHEFEFTRFVDDIVLNALVEGTAIAYVAWERRVEHQVTEEVVRSEEDSGEVDVLTGLPIRIATHRRVIVDRDNVVREGPRVDLIPLVDFLVADWGRRRVEDQPWVAHRVRLYTKELEALKGVEGYFDEEIDELLKGMGNQYTEGGKPPYVQMKEELTGVSHSRISTLEDVRWWEIWVIYTYYDHDDDGKPERVQFELAMPQGRLIRALRFPYLHNKLPYIVLTLQPRPYTFFGRSLVADLKMTQDEIDAIHNMRTDATQVAIGALFTPIFDDQVSFPADRTRISLGEPLQVEGDIQHLEILGRSLRTINPPGMDVEQLLLSFAERISGISDPHLGKPTPGRKTAFEIASLIQEGNVRFRRMIERAAVALAELDYQLVALYEQFAPRVESKVARVIGRPSRVFSGLGSGIFRFRIHGAAIASNQDLDSRRALELLQLVEQSPILQTFVKQSPRRMYALAKAVLDKIGRGDLPVESIIGTEAEAVSMAQAAPAPPAPPAGPPRPPRPPGPPAPPEEPGVPPVSPPVPPTPVEEAGGIM